MQLPARAGCIFTRYYSISSQIDEIVSEYYLRWVYNLLIHCFQIIPNKFLNIIPKISRNSSLTKVQDEFETGINSRGASEFFNEFI
jgi:hypothetical protein